MNIQNELNRRFAGKTVRFWQADEKRPLRESAKLYIEGFRPMLENEYNPLPEWRRRILWTEETICAVINWDKSDYFDPLVTWSPDQPSEFMAHLMPIVMDADFFFKDNRCVSVWRHENITMLEVAE